MDSIGSSILTSDAPEIRDQTYYFFSVIKNQTKSGPIKVADQIFYVYVTFEA